MDLLSVWLLDDDSEDRMLFEEALDVGGTKCKFRMFKDGTGLVEALKIDIPTILFLDLYSPPPLDGLEILKFIKAKYKNENNIIVVIFSTSSSGYDHESTYAEGADMYVVKPTNFQALISIIADTCSTDWKARSTTEDNFIYQSLS